MGIFGIKKWKAGSNKEKLRVVVSCCLYRFAKTFYVGV